jgi:hypothetical protein
MVPMMSTRCQVTAIMCAAGVPSRKGHIDGGMPLLLTTSRPSSEQGWQIRQSRKSWSRPSFGMRRGADQDRSGPEVGCPIKSLSAVIDNQRPLRLHACIGEEARKVRWPCFEGVHQVSPVEAAKAMPHTQPLKRPGQFQRARAGGGMQRVPLAIQEMGGFDCAGQGCLDTAGDPAERGTPDRGIPLCAGVAL